MDYIKYDAQRTSENFTQEYLEKMLENYVISIYGKDNAYKIIQEIAPVEKLILNGNIPSLAQTRSSASTNIAIAAANECMDKIKSHLNKFKDDEIFDNNSLLEELHLIITQTYDTFLKKCGSDEERLSLSQSLGVLYGSIEYWTNSDNVVSWSKLKKDNNSGTYSGTTSNSKLPMKNRARSSSRKLSKQEYITVVAAADTAGSFLGAAIASGPAAVAASAAAALYFDVR